MCCCFLARHRQRSRISPRLLTRAAWVWSLRVCTCVLTLFTYPCVFKCVSLPARAAYLLPHFHKFFQLHTSAMGCITDGFRPLILLEPWPGSSNHPPRSLVVSSDTSLSFSLSVRSVFWGFCVSEYFGRHAPLSHALLCWLQPMLWLYSYDFCTNKKHFLGLHCFATLFTDRMWYDLIRSDRHWTPLYFCSQHVRSWLLLQF